MSNDHAAKLPATATPLATTADVLGSPWYERLVIALARRALGGPETGRLALTLPSGTSAMLAGGRQGHDARLAIRDYGVLWHGLTRGKLAFAECYMDGRIDIDDLGALFHFVLDNEAAMQRAPGRMLRLRAPDRRYHASHANTREGSRRNIAAHYDLGNAFYRLWLDRGMNYSSGIYAEPDDTLADAQAAKLARVIDALELEPGHALLEIGCGWGSLLEAAAHRGATATGITLSAEQLEWSLRRLSSAGLGANATARFLDYRDTEGTYDRVASIEMIEAVGEANWPTYFRVLAERLAPGGIGVIQAITIPEQFFDDYRRSPDFIQRYIFPGGMLPTIEAMQRHAEANGLRFETFERFGGSYALTLRAWRERFHVAWPKISELGFDERFRRMWDYYLAYCAAGFESGVIDVGLYRVHKA